MAEGGGALDRYTEVGGGRRMSGYRCGGAGRKKDVRLNINIWMGGERRKGTRKKCASPFSGGGPPPNMEKMQEKEEQFPV